MNTNPKAKRILCYGDSNTWGYIPAIKKRYPPDLRWPGVLQNLLGDSYEIIEEGVNSRTTVFDDPKHIGKNGKIYLVPCLETHNPIDIVILFLGTNDIKERFNRNPKQIRAGIEELIKLIKGYAWNNDNKPPRIILVSPTIVDEAVPGVQEKYKGAQVKSEQLGKEYAELAKKYNLEFVDAAKIVLPSKKDGYHLEPNSHKKLAEAFREKISKLY